MKVRSADQQMEVAGDVEKKARQSLTNGGVAQEVTQRGSSTNIGVNWLGLACACVAMLGCVKATNQDQDAGLPSCSKRDDCATGEVCGDAGVCAKCVLSNECGAKEICDPAKKLCTFRAGWGDVCTTNELCPAGAWCKQGLCVSRASVTLCPGGVNTECAAGERCNTGTFVCEEDLGCESARDCAATETCLVASKQCAPRCTAETQASICGAGEKCAGDHCVQCAGNADCGPGLTCNSTGRCTASAQCLSDRDCESPLVCFPQIGACLPKRPPCLNDDSCSADTRCELKSGRCVPRACLPDQFEPNNDDTKAATPRTNVAYRGLTLCDADVDWYAFTLNRGDQLGVNVTADPFSESNFTTVIKEASGRAVASGAFLANHVATSTGRYVVVITSTDSSAPYDVSFLLSRGVPCDDDSLEPNDTSSTATMLNATTVADGAICPQDADWFSYSVPAAKGLKASFLNYDPNRGALRLCLHEGTQQLSCSDAEAPSVTAAASRVGGKAVKLKVVGSTELTKNSYTLKLEVLP